MGGLYRDQGLEVVRKWIIPVIQPRVEAMYQNLRDDYIPEAIPLTRIPTSPHPLPSPPSTSLESAGHALPSRPARDSGDSHRSLRPRTNVSQQGSERVRGGVENRPEDVDKSKSNRKRRRPSQGDGRNGDSGKQGLVLLRKRDFVTIRFRFSRCVDRTLSSHCKRGSDRSERSSKRQRG